MCCIVVNRKRSHTEGVWRTCKDLTSPFRKQYRTATTKPWKSAQTHYHHNNTDSTFPVFTCFAHGNFVNTERDNATHSSTLIQQQPQNTRPDLWPLWKLLTLPEWRQKRARVGSRFHRACHRVCADGRRRGCSVSRRGTPGGTTTSPVSCVSDRVQWDQ